MKSIPIGEVINFLETHKNVDLERQSGSGATHAMKAEIKIIESPYLAAVLSSRRDVKDFKIGDSCLIAFKFEGVICYLNVQIKLVLEDGVVVLEAKRAFRRPQERGNFRIDVEMPVKFWFRSKGGQHDTFFSVSREVNISGGGLQFTADVPIEKDDNLGLELGLPDGRPAVRCAGHVVRVIPLTKKHYSAALYFTNISAEDRERIVALGFAQQRKKLRGEK